MSIIIRLQNLPWSANALDIRQFFTGLQIPEGGVHIVGGELGDAFIAFSTDEDARQAFLRTDGRIKGIQVKLMLSSRTEMQRVIEQARTQSMAAFMLPTAPQSVPQVPIAANTVPMPAAVPQVVQPAAVPDLQRDRDDKDDYSDRRRDGRRRSRSKSRGRDRDKSRRRHRDRSRTRSKSRDRRDRRGRRDKSRSRNRSRDRDSRRGRDRTRSSSTRDIDNSKKIPDIWETRPQQSLNIIPPAGIISPSPWNLPPQIAPNFPVGFGGPPAPSITPPVALQRGGRDSWPPVNQNSREPFTRSPDFSSNNPVITSTTNRPQLEVRNPPPVQQNRPPNKARNEDFPDPRAMREEIYGSNMIDRRGRFEPPRNGKKSRYDDADSTTHSGPVNACVSLEPFYGSYGDLRKFFNKLIINFNGIKVINDEYGHKTGVCLVQFRDSFNKVEALKMDGADLNESIIKIKPISDKVFDEAIDRYNPKMNELNPNNDQLERNKNTKKFLNNEPEISNFSCLKLEDLPSMVKEQDILHIFSHHPLISLHLDVKPKGGTAAYVKFSSRDVAKTALNEMSQHVIRGKPITVKPCTDEDFNKINMQQDVVLQVPPKVESDCLNVMNLPNKTTDRDISDFFSDIGVIPVKIHLMSNNMGFTGQAYCEFENNEEATKASAKNGVMLGQNTIKVELIARKEVEDVLGNSLPHPGTAPGESLPPGTPLPPIKPTETSPAPEIKEEVKEVPVKVEQSVPPPEPAQKLNFQSPAHVDHQPEQRFDHPRFDDHPVGRFNDRFNDRPFNDDRRQFEGGHFDGPPLRGMFNGIRGRGFGFRGRGFGPRGGDDFGPRGPPDFQRFQEQEGNFHPRNDHMFDHRGVDDFPPPRGMDFRHRGRGFGPNRGGIDPRFDERPRNQGPAQEEDDMDDERPGCIVFMDNVPYKAGTDEILDFFAGYNCTENVSRRYNPDNTPSAEAKVTFFTPSDAFRAVRELNMKTIWGRSIYLRQE